MTTPDVDLPPITDEDKQLLHYNPNTVDVVEWVQAYAREAALLERERCAALCDAYSKHLIASGKFSDLSEYEAHAAEACSNLIRGLNEFGDAPDSEHFGGSFAAAIRAKKAD